MEVYKQCIGSHDDTYVIRTGVQVKYNGDRSPSKKISNEVTRIGLDTVVRCITKLVVDMLHKFCNRKLIIPIDSGDRAAVTESLDIGSHSLLLLYMCICMGEYTKEDLCIYDY